MKTKLLLYAGLLSPLVFWTTTLICGLMIDDYNHLSGMVSELGALGTRTQFLFTTGLILSSILNIFFVTGAYKMSKKLKISIIPIFFLLFYSFLAGPAIFPMPLRLHGIVGIPFVLIMLAPILSLILWKRYEQILKIRQIAIYSQIIMLLGFLIFLPNILPEYFGLKQRFLYLGWSLWSVYLSYRFITMKTVNNTNVIETGFWATLNDWKKK